MLFFFCDTPINKDHHTVLYNSIAFIILPIKVDTLLPLTMLNVFCFVLLLFLFILLLFFAVSFECI